MIKANLKYNRIVQIGYQRRSGSGLIQMIADIHAGIIGNVYMAKCWYANLRGPVYFKDGPVPSWLDYELWQGPAPRRPYKEGLVHYNWHWTRHWGTGESPMNASHEVDIARWGLGVEFPVRVSSMGGRYFFKDDNEWPDTQIFSLEFPENKLIVWEGRSCNGFKSDGADRGTIFYGDKGTVINPGGNSYTVYDKMGKVIKESRDSSDSTDTTNTASPGVNLDQMHIENFLNSIREGKTPTCDCETGHSSTLLTQIANIALLTKQTLEIDPKNGHILNNPAAQQL
jgi:predicted dehydrogenase